MLEEEQNRSLLELQAECEQLRQRNAALVEYIAKIQSTASSLSNVPEAKAPTIQMRTEEFQKSTLNKCQTDADNTTFMTEKITLFKSLFKGRRDVYALRWQARDGKSGYSPACANEWNRQYQTKKEILVYDYVDVNVPIFSKMYQKRVKKYCAMGYSICEN